VLEAFAKGEGLGAVRELAFEIDSLLAAPSDEADLADLWAKELRAAYDPVAHGHPPGVVCARAGFSPADAGRQRDRFVVRGALVLVVAFLVGLGIAIPATSAAAAPTNLDQVDSYASDVHRLIEIGSGSAGERGPPTAYDLHTTNDASGRWSDCTSAHSMGSATWGYYRPEKLAPILRELRCTYELNGAMYAGGVRFSRVRCYRFRN
jgi:hypothetical protein